MDEATAKKIISQRRGMEKVRKYCDKNLLPYPPELCEWLMDLQRWRNGD